MGPLSARKFIGAGLLLLGLLLTGLLIATKISPGFLTGEKKPTDAAPQMTTASADATVTGFTAAASRDPTPPLPSGQGYTPGQTSNEVPDGLTDLEQRLFTEALERESRRALELEERRWAAANSPLGNSIHGVVPGQNAPSQDRDQTGLAQPYGNQPATFPDLVPNLAPTIPLPDFDRQTTPDQNPASAQSSTQSRVPQGRATQSTLAAGTVIAAALMGDIRSELPGLVRAMVTHDIFDSQTLRFVVIPRGAQLLGSYSNQTQAGQQRLFVWWTRVRFPDGRVFDLDRSATLDARGASGLTGRRQTGFLTAIVQGALLGLAQNAGRGGARDAAQNSDLAEAARIATGQAVGTVTERFLEGRLARGTRFTIRAGTVLNLILVRDFDFPAVAREHGALDQSVFDDGQINPGIPDQGALDQGALDQRALDHPAQVRPVGNTGRTAAAALVLVAGDAAQTDPTDPSGGPGGTNLDAGTNPTAGTDLGAGTDIPYDRSDYGRWADIDGDCQNTRHEILESLSTARVLKSADGCVVTRGRWLDPYTGAIELNPRALDVDHLVPLAWAHWHGAARWPAARKRAFANDPRNLFATQAAVNRAKGARGPLDWLPPNAGVHCAYVTRFDRIVRIWELTYTDREAQDMVRLRGRLCV